MKYMLLINMDPKAHEALTEEQQAAVGAAHGKLMALVEESGELVAAEALSEPVKTTVVRVRDGETVASEGPLADSEVYFCGYYIVDVAGRERAIELAAMIPDAEWSAVEVRPFFEMPEEG
ncbi:MULTISPECIES: YciI family protein [unclassified Streptomyces]|uniref:YciI family protein n=1 Tax=unclassified Streptomyces TaxID=2593676 RepID=UPI000CD56756|nr:MULTISPECIES: YciI family protein [unclassified Streptomyces]